MVFEKAVCGEAYSGCFLGGDLMKMLPINPGIFDCWHVMICGTVVDLLDEISVGPGLAEVSDFVVGGEKLLVQEHGSIVVWKVVGKFIGTAVRRFWSFTSRAVYPGWLSDRVPDGQVF